MPPPPAVTIAPGVRRLTAPNPGAFTADGTNSYILGTGRVAIIDPGPDDARHVAALLAATAGETITDIFLTHTHRDHSGALPALAAASGARTLSGGPYRPARPLLPGETAAHGEANDTGHVPDVLLADGDLVSGEGWRIAVVATPGHAANHLAFALPAADLVLSGDHVMGWSSSIVAPPDGSMSAYMASLDRLAARPEGRLLPGHGPPVDDGHARIAALRRHRLAREAGVLERLAAGDRTIPEIVAALYAGLDPALADAAALSVLAHVEDLVARGRIRAEGGGGVAGRYALTR